MSEFRKNILKNGLKNWTKKIKGAPCKNVHLKRSKVFNLQHPISEAKIVKVKVFVN